MSVWQKYPKLDAKLRKLAPDFSASQIAEKLGHGISRNAVLSYCNRHGIALRGHEPKAKRGWHPWRGADFSRLETMAAEGAPSSEIARELKRPRWSVEKHAAQRGITLQRIKAPSLPAGSQPHPPALVLADGRRIGIMDLSATTCRWPHGDPTAEDFHYCGHKPKPGSRYCEHHAARAVSKARTVIGEALADQGRNAERQFARVFGAAA
ncbi:MAG: hypothetical protein JO256_09185 [Alphaproteobacteria bacterium]|nr:hypothetical protein [Alphaproteobacteria bacterium]